MEQTQTHKRRYGVNRWFILAFVLGSIFLAILSSLGMQALVPVRPHLQVAAENLSEKPWFTLPVIGDFYPTNTLVGIILVDLVILLIASAVRSVTRDGGLVPKGIAGAMEALLEVVYNLTESAAGKWASAIFPWFISILLLVIVANLVKLVPIFETFGYLHQAAEGHPIQLLGGNWYVLLPGNTPADEGYQIVPFFRGPSTDLNFTVSLAIISVLMTQIIGFRAQGARYLYKFFNVINIFKKPFFGFMDFLVGLLELISELAKILSFSFRLFGVMFSGVVLTALVSTMVPVFVPSLILMFEVFMAAIQAFVFGMLTMVFMAQATQGHAAEEHE